MEHVEYMLMCDKCEHPECTLKRFCCCDENSFQISFRICMPADDMIFGNIPCSQYMYV